VLNTSLTAVADVNATKIFVNTTSIFDPRDLITIGWSDANETVAVNEVGKNYLILDRKLQINHDIGEPVVILNKKLKLYDNITWKGRFYVLLKVVVTKPEVYEIKMTAPENCTLNIYSLNQGLYRLPYGKKAETSSKIQSVLDINPRTKFMIVDGTAGNVLKVPVSVKVLFGPASYTHEDLNVLYPPAYVYAKSNPPKGFYVDTYGDLGAKGEIYIVDAFPGSKDTGYWVISRSSVSSQISSYNSEDYQAIANLFTEKPGKYLYGLEITFYDILPQFSGQNVSTTLYIDDFALKLYGNAYGLMGTDHFGRDLFAQLVYGTRISLYIGLLVAILSVAIGLIVGLAAGYLGGAADQFLMRFNDLLLVLPGLPLLIVLVSVLGTRIENLILLLGFLGWNGFARVVRSQVLSLRERPFIEAAKAAGAGTGHILLRHVLPSIMSLVYISLATSVPGAITAEAALAWLGFYDPNRMSWGRMLHEVFTAGATRNWWWILPPGICIAAIAVAFILLGYALDEILNPKLRIRR
jgi:ABC-type dipeptide/oligopeptide/nickel transport system permease subunit